MHDGGYGNLLGGPRHLNFLGVFSAKQRLRSIGPWARGMRVGAKGEGGKVSQA